jgi:hypothetical protein
MAIINGFSISLTSADHYGLHSASLPVSAPLLPAILHDMGGPHVYDPKTCLMDATGDYQPGDVQFDVPSEGASIKIARCMYLCRNQSPSDHHCHSLPWEGQRKCGVGPVLTPVVGADEVYTRVGYVYSSPFGGFWAPRGAEL